MPPLIYGNRRNFHSQIELMWFIVLISCIFHIATLSAQPRRPSLESASYF